MVNKYANKKNVNAKRNDEFIKSAGEKCRLLNLLCAAFFAVVLILFFCDFFRVSIDGKIDDRVNGFTMSFLLFGNVLKNSGGLLTVVNKKYSGEIKFASVMSLLCLITVITFIGIFVYRAIKKKPLLSKPILIISSLAFILFIIQIVACGSLSSTVTANYYAGCATCLAQTLSYLILILYIVIIIAYSIMSYWLYNTYGIAFKELTQIRSTQPRK